MVSRRGSASPVRVLCALVLLALPGVARAGPDPCKFLTPAQVAAVLGGTFGAGEPIGTTGCSWTSAKPHIIVTISLWPPNDWDRMKAGGLPGTKIAPESGLGDDAFYATLAQYTMLYVKKGQSVLLFKVYGVKEQARQASAEKTFALEALKQL